MGQLSFIVRYTKTYASGLIEEVDPSRLVVVILTTGARIPVIRLKAEQSASPVPL